MGKIDPFLQNPAPDFDTLVRVFKGEQKPDRVHVTEIMIDAEVLQAIKARFLGQKWIPDTKETREACCTQMIDLYYRLGYDAVLEGGWRDVWVNHPPMPSLSAEDTAVSYSVGRESGRAKAGGLSRPGTRLRLITRSMK